MAQLRSGGSARLLDLVVALLDDEASEPPWQTIASTVLEAAGGTVAMIAQFDAVTGTNHRPLAWTHEPSRALAAERVRRYGPGHPLAPIFANGWSSPLRISDVVGIAEWRRYPAYGECMRVLDGAVFHLGVPLPRPSPDTVRSLLLGRAGRTFPDRAVEVCRYAQALLLRLDRHAAELRRLRAAVGPPHAADPVGTATSIGITPRELTVLSLLAQGHTAAAIGRRLGITPATVSKHQAGLYRKLGARDRLTAVLTAQRLALLP